MCPRCNSQARTATDPEYVWCYFCGEVPKPGMIRLDYMIQEPRMPKASNKAPHAFGACMDCGKEIEARSKRCRECALKVVKAL